MAEKFRVMMYGMGKMGTAVYHAIKQQNLSSSDFNISVTDAYDTDPKKMEDLRGINTFSSKGKDENALAGALKDFDNLKGVHDTNVIVDFTSEKGCRNLFKKFECMAFGPEPPSIVTGTTPLSSGTKDYIQGVARENSIVAVHAPNFSINVNQFLHDMENIVPPSPEDFITIHEMHRRDKATTSGIAIVIAKILCQRFGKDGYITSLPSPVAYKSDGTAICLIASEIQTCRESPSWIDISAIRHADEPGTHVVKIGNENSYRKYEVRATRKDYADGVVRAIRELPKFAESGIYDFMKDVLYLV